MKALYVHENRYWQEDDVFYAAGQFGQDYWQTYLGHFDRLTAIGRAANTAFAPHKMTVSSNERISFKLLPNLSGLLAFVKNRAAVTKEIVSLVSKHDAVIIRSVTEFGWLAFKAAKRQGKFIVIEMSGCPWDAMRHYPRWYAKCFAPIRLWRGKVQARQADAVLYVTEHFLQKRYPTKVLQGFASNVRIENTGTIKTLSESFKIGLIGHLDNGLKGIEVAIEALSRLDTATLHLLGQGDATPYKALAKKLGVAGRVFFDGLLPSGEAVSTWLDSIDLYIQPSFHEGLPRALIEAMSRACPAFGSDVGGISELLPSPQLHKAGDARTLAKQLQKVIDDPEHFKQLSLYSLEKVKDYTADQLIPKRRAFWSKVTGAAKIERAISIGPQRCGTSWIDAYLRQRGDVCLPRYVKETYFFDRYFAKGLGFYNKHFKGRNAHKTQVEMAVSYFYDSQAAQNIYETYGKDVTLLCPLRGPVERAVSHYQHYRQYGIVSGSFSEAILKHPEIIEGSRYSVYIPHWDKIFGSDKINYLFLETLKNDPKTYTQNLCAFLGIDFIELQVFVANKAQQPRFSWLAALGQNVAEALRSVGAYVFVDMAKKMGFKKLFFMGGTKKSQLTDTERQHLANLLDSETEFYKALLGSESKNCHNERINKEKQYG
jgi:glycosyltransferase involved in cell wall biosynthesis